MLLFIEKNIVNKDLKKSSDLYLVSMDWDFIFFFILYFPNFLY